MLSVKYKLRQTSSENRANLADVDILSESYKDSDDVRSVMQSGVVHQSHASVIMFAKSR